MNKSNIVIMSRFMQQNHHGYGKTPGKFVTDYVNRDDATESLITDVSKAGLVTACAATMVEHGYGTADIDELSQQLGLPLHGMYRSFGNDGVNYSLGKTVAVANHLQSLYQQGLTVQRLVVSFKDDKVLQQLGVSDYRHQQRGDYRNHVDELKLRHALNYGMSQLAIAGHFSRPVWIGAIQVDTNHVHAHMVIGDDVSIAASQRQWHHREQRGEFYRKEINALRQGVTQQLLLAPTVCFSSDLASHDLLMTTAKAVSIGMQQRHAQLFAQPSVTNEAEYQQEPVVFGITLPHDYQHDRDNYQRQTTARSKLTVVKQPFSATVKQLRTDYQHFNAGLQQSIAMYQRYLDYQMVARSMPLRDAWRQFYQHQLAFQMALTDKYRLRSHVQAADKQPHLQAPVQNAVSRLDLMPADLLFSLQQDNQTTGSHQVALANTTAHLQLWTAGLIKRQRVLTDIDQLNHGQFVSGRVAAIDNFVNDYPAIKDIDVPVSSHPADVQLYQQGLQQRQHNDDISWQLLQHFYDHDDDQLKPVKQQVTADNEQLAALQAWQAQQAAASQAVLLQQQSRQLDELLASQRSAAAASAASQAASLASQATQPRNDGLDF